MQIDYEVWRGMNSALAGLGFLLSLLWSYKWWDRLPRNRKLRMMSLCALLLVGSYGSFEAAYLTTQYRVPMYTVAVVWAIVAHFIAEETNE